MQIFRVYFCTTILCDFLDHMWTKSLITRWLSIIRIFCIGKWKWKRMKRREKRRNIDFYKSVLKGPRRGQLYCKNISFRFNRFHRGGQFILRVYLLHKTCWTGAVLMYIHISMTLPGQKSFPSQGLFTYPNWLHIILVLPIALSIFVWEWP